MRIIWDNAIDDYTPIVSSEVASRPAANVKDPRLSRPWRTAALDEWYKVDAEELGAGKKITANSASVLAHNLTAGATVRVQANDTDAWGAPAVNVLVTWDAAVMVIFFPSSTRRFWRFLVQDAGNADGYLEIGRLVLGVMLQMPPVEPNMTLPSVTTTKAEASITGQVYGDRGQRFWVPSFTFPNITEAERQLIMAMWDDVENVTPVVLIVWEDSLSVQRPIYCKIDQESMEWQRNPDDDLSWYMQIAFREAK